MHVPYPFHVHNRARFDYTAVTRMDASKALYLPRGRRVVVSRCIYHCQGPGLHLQLILIAYCNLRMHGAMQESRIAAESSDINKDDLFFPCKVKLRKA